MTAPYKKRAKAGYNNDKTSSNRSERLHIDKEIQEQLSDESPLKSVSKAKEPKLDKNLSSHLSHLRLAIQMSKGNGLNYLKEYKGDSFFQNHYQRIYQDAKKAITYFKQLSTPVPNKIKKQIKELMDQVTDHI